ncbi:hypothetical protein C8R46DRAFT_1106318 [Mycena filopes]|nr:hypothetical protein C8R46DRAFT_1106318 [Mycena filopes]
MFSTLALVVATAVAAQAASSNSTTTNPYIPTDISSGCSTFLTTLNADTDLTACTSALITATSAYGPGGTSGTASKAAVSATLDTVCSTSACPPNLIAAKLLPFNTECNAELTTSPNAEVKTIYDTFYGLIPLVGALCAKDDSGARCPLAGADSAAAAALAPAIAVPAAASSSSSSHVRRADGSTVTAYMANATIINDSNLMFLFLKEDLPKAQLCTTCTRQVLTSYINYETTNTYAPGLGQSVLMSGQSALYAGVVNVCGADFLTSAVKAAGGLSQAGGSSGALSVRAGAGGALSVLVGAAVAVSAAILL